MTGAVQLGLDGQAAVVGARPDDDHYATPGWLVEAALDAMALPRPCGSVLDAGAGDGRLAFAVQQRVAPGCTFSLVEIDEPRALRAADRLGMLASRSADIVEGWGADFLTWAPRCGRRFDLVISNPPFRLWDEFVRAMLRLVAPGGTCLVLGFVNVLGGQGRAAWWRANPPSRIWLSPRRASFTADGATDSRDCCWVEWSPGERRAEVRWLETERP